ncbi:MAG: hypothetical protein IKC03_07020 [Oscillospiraceae bacterium]|nr:hypothetical protein [Oscillospiraceae bacterium]
MGLMKFFDKALALYQRHLPEIMEFTEKVEEQQRNAYGREQEKMEEMEVYKAQYVHLSDEELKSRYNMETGLKKKAVYAVLRERNAQRAEWKRIYSGLDIMQLKIELKMLEQRATHYGEMQGHKLTQADADARKQVLLSVLRQLDCVQSE